MALGGAEFRHLGQRSDRADGRNGAHGRKASRRSWDRWVLLAPVSVYAGWLTAASFVSVASTLCGLRHHSRCLGLGLGRHPCGARHGGGCAALAGQGARIRDHRLAGRWWPWWCRTGTRAWPSRCLAAAGVIVVGATSAPDRAPPGLSRIFVRRSDRASSVTSCAAVFRGAFSAAEGVEGFRPPLVWGSCRPLTHARSDGSASQACRNRACRPFTR